MKYFAVLILVLLTAYVQSSSAQSHNITWGTITPYDQLLSREIVMKTYKFLRIVTEDYKYSITNNNYKNITGIRVTDQYTNGNGGYATLYAGGPGSNQVTIHMKSQRNHGFNFIVEIFGR